MENWKKYLFHEEENEYRKAWVYAFPNKFGISLLKWHKQTEIDKELDNNTLSLILNNLKGTHYGNGGAYEIGLMNFNKNNSGSHLCYDEEFFVDVIQHLDFIELPKYFNIVSSFRKNKKYKRHLTSPFDI